MKYMERWGLHESFLRGKLSSEMPQLFTLLSTVPLLTPGPKMSLRAEMGVRQLCWTVLWKQQCWLHSQRSRSQTQDEAESVRVSVQKAIFLASAFCFSISAMCDASKWLKKTVACCYETYRMWREGTVERPSHFVFCCDISTMIANAVDAKGSAEDPAAMLV